MRFFGNKPLLKLTAQVDLTSAGVKVTVVVDGDPELVDIVQQLLQPEREPSFEDILAAAMRGDGGPMESPSFEDALAAAMSGRGSPIDIGEMLAQVLGNVGGNQEFPDVQEVYAAYMMGDYTNNERIVNDGAICIALAKGEELPEDVIIPQGVRRIVTRYQQGVRDCHCGQPDCRAHFFFKMLEAYFAQYGESDQLNTEDELDAQNYQDGYRA